MIGREFHFHDGEKGAALAIKIVTSKKENQIEKILFDGTVVVNLKGKSQHNDEELIKFLSKKLGINQKRFEVIAGEDREDKLISILGIKPERLQEIVLQQIS